MSITALQPNIVISRQQKLFPRTGNEQSTLSLQGALLTLMIVLDLPPTAVPTIAAYTKPLYYKPLHCRNLYNNDTILCPSVVL